MSARYKSANAKPLLAGLALSVAVLAGTLSGCSGRDADLSRFIDATKKEPGGRVDPLPEVKPYDAYNYADQELRSPFVPGGSGGANANLRPDNHRNREYLEQFSLDTLRMVGTLNLGGGHYGLVATTWVPMTARSPTLRPQKLLWLKSFPTVWAAISSVPRPWR